MNSALQTYANNRLEITAEEVEAFFRPYLDQGHKGLKTGQGFYKQPVAEFQKPDFLEVEGWDSPPRSAAPE